MRSSARTYHQCDAHAHILTFCSKPLNTFWIYVRFPFGEIEIAFVAMHFSDVVWENIKDETTHSFLAVLLSIIIIIPLYLILFHFRSFYFLVPCRFVVSIASAWNWRNRNDNKTELKMPTYTIRESAWINDMHTQNFMLRNLQWGARALRNEEINWKITRLLFTHFVYDIFHFIFEFKESLTVIS